MQSLSVAAYGDYDNERADSMFFFHHPRKVTSDRAVAVQVVQNKDLREPIALVGAVLVVDPPPKNNDFDKDGRPLLR